MFKKIEIDDFRIFKNQTVEIGETLTVIAGHNASGKSTILSLLANSSEIAAGKGKLITGKRFRAEFSEIMKGSKTFDKKSGTIGRLYYEDNKINLRVTWQAKDKDDTEKTRFRVIPKRFDPEKGKNVESKLPIPSYYLGLSRLYPFGEAENFSARKIALTADDLEWLERNYSNILSLDIPIQSISGYKIDQKISGGINTETYDFITNSSGQDNLMQILYVLLSFKKLKEKNGPENWNGGLFTIDEIDASLHPAAQVKLLELLYDFSKENKVQIVFTTHSLQILSYLSEKRKRCNDISIAYLTTANNILEIKTNPEYEFMKNDMLVTTFYDYIEGNQIPVYTEDEEARWLLKKLLPDHLSRMRIINIKLGSDSLMDLLKNDSSYFQNVLFILDGDKDLSKDPYKTLAYRYCNILSLPGGESPEAVLSNYLLNLPAGHEILQLHGVHGISLRSLKEESPLLSTKYQNLEKDRDKYKEWFKNNKTMLEDINVFEYWANDHAEECKKFEEEFINRYNIVASRAHLPKLS